MSIRDSAPLRLQRDECSSISVPVPPIISVLVSPVICVVSFCIGQAVYSRLPANWAVPVLPVPPVISVPVSPVLIACHYGCAAVLQKRAYGGRVEVEFHIPALKVEIVWVGQYSIDVVDGNLVDAGIWAGWPEEDVVPFGN